MRSSIESVEDNKVKLSVSVEASELEPAIEQAWKTIAKEVRIPGFRAGKAPRKVLETRIEPGYARSEAIQQAIPEFYTDAVNEHEVDVIAQPEIDITEGEESGDLSFDATVEVRPIVEITGYADLSIEIPSPHPSDDDIADQIDRLRGQYAELNVVERPAATGDLVTIDIEGSRDGETVEGLQADDYSYEVGSAVIVAELDDQLRGLKAGEKIEFTADHPSDEEEPVNFAVEVKEVKEKVLPELNDEWVQETSEFQTVDEFRDDIIERLTTARKAQATSAAQNKIGEGLSALVTEDVPDALLGSEMRARLESLANRLQQQGLDLETYMSATGTDAGEFTESLRTEASEAIKVDLALRAVARQEGIEVTDEQLDEEITHIAVHAGVDAEVARKNLTEGDQLPQVRSEVSRRSALKWITERVTIVDEGGSPVNPSDLDLDPDDDHDH